jgi:hypothetical protein
MWCKFNARCCGEKIAINKEPSWKHLTGCVKIT